MLRVALTGRSPSAIVAVRATWRGFAPDRATAVEVDTVTWPVDLGTAARFHLVAGVAPDGPPAGDAVDVWIRPDDAVALWRDRIAPFQANLDARRRAPRRRAAVLVESDPTWPAQAGRIGARLRHALGDQVERIDHIGSTSVPGLPAKDLVDVQVVVRDLATAREAASRADRAGLVYVAGEWTARDRAGTRYREEALVDADPGRPTNVNLRPVGDPVWREALLFRDWLRADVRNRDAYLDEKRRLAATARHVDDYGDGKLDWIGDALARAEHWAGVVGWAP